MVELEKCDRVKLVNETEELKRYRIFNGDIGSVFEIIDEDYCIVKFDKDNFKIMVRKDIFVIPSEEELRDIMADNLADLY